MCESSGLVTPTITKRKKKSVYLVDPFSKALVLLRIIRGYARDSKFLSFSTLCLIILFFCLGFMVKNNKILPYFPFLLPHLWSVWELEGEGKGRQ